MKYFNLDGTSNGFTRQRLFPSIQHNGHTQKYYQPKGSDPHPYFPPIVDWQKIASDPSQRFYIAEGEKKAAALCQKEVPCIGIAGVWNWRSKLDKNERCTCPELDQFVWKSREVELIPDSDGWRDGKLFDVLGGFYALAMDLVQRGAKLKFVKLPEVIPGVKTGLDDWLVSKGDLWQWQWDSLERVSLDDSRLRKLAKWWQDWIQRQGEDKTQPFKIFNMTDFGNAERLVARHGKGMRFCHKLGKYFLWDDTRWVLDDSVQVMGLAKETARHILAEAAQLPDKTERTELINHAKSTESYQRLQSMVKLATSEPGISIKPDNFDQDPWLLNCLNGTVDLRTGELLPHQPEHLISKIVPIEFDPDAYASLWEGFLERIMRDDEGQRRIELEFFLQRLIGYTLTGLTREQIVAILWGVGANGKSVFLETVNGLLGAYAKVVDFSTFSAKANDRIRNDLARLPGARLVSASEGESGMKLSESLIKQLTGGDLITARFLFREYFEYRPTFTPFLVTNHKPIIRGTDHAMWRRIRLIPFTQVISDEEQDKDLARKLKGEYPGILAWAVQGCLDWQQHGLGLPEDVKIANEAYRSEMDTLGDFINARCEIADYASIRSSDLYGAYAEWCNKNGEQPLSQNRLALQLVERGFRKEHTRSGNLWRGIGLNQAENAEKESKF